MKKFSLSICVLLLVIAAKSQNPQLLKDVFPGATGSSIQQIVKTSNYTFFNADDDDLDTDRGLFRTDGTISGTIKLNLRYIPDPPPSPNNYASTKAEKLTAIGNKIVFAGDNFPNYGEIWSSDGTQAGTIAIERFQPNSPNVSPIVEINAMGSYAYYSAVNNSNQAILKRTDGTFAGTTEIYNFGSYTGIPQVVFLTPVNNILYFLVYDQFGTGVDQLWRSDGTTAGTYMVYNFGPNQYVASYIMPAGNNLYIMTVVPGTGNVLWKSDGTAAGSMNVKTIASSGNNNYPAFAAIGSTFYFGGLDGNGKELWKSDGTAAGTVMVSDINPGTASSNPSALTVLNNQLYFSATTVNEGTELWKYDGANASLVKDINPGSAASSPGSLVVSNNSILMRATTLLSGAELWVSDGTSSNTQQVADINPGTGSSNPNTMTAGNNVYFSADNAVVGRELFKYDNTQGLAGLRKIYVNDNSLVGDVFTTAIGNNANQGTQSAPVATVSYALTIAQAGDTIMVDAGTYTEQITTDKSISIKGAGQNLTNILKPAVTVAPPGTFTEQGVIQTSQSIIGDVHVSDVSITGDYTVNVTPLIIQTGGSIKNCKLQGGNQGIFVRIDPEINAATKTFLVDRNSIEAEFIAVNFAGTNLTATLSNNSLAVFNQGFSTAVFAGLNFSPLAGLTVTGNTIGSYFTDGILVNTNNGIISQNNFTGIGPKAINNIGGNTITASCNWYGSPLAATVASKITVGVNYSPWLNDGTDNNPAIGFQTSISCPVANSYYVNDNNITGDVYTTAVGNNANSGTFNAPYATLNYAISQVPAGATIYVDAGQYPERLFVNKPLYIKGAYGGVSPGSLLSRGASESILIPSSENNISEIITVQSPKVTIDGFVFDGDNPTITGSILLNGVDVNAGMGIYNGNLQTDSLQVKNNIFKNFYRYGLLIQRTLTPIIGNLISSNRFDNISSKTGRDGRAVGLFNNTYATVSDNNFTRVNSAVFIANQAQGSNDSILINRNTISAYTNGIFSSFTQNLTSSFNVHSNEITLADLASWNSPGASQVNSFSGINIGVLTTNNKVLLENNVITNANTGVNIGTLTTSNKVVLKDNVITNTNTGMFLARNSSLEPFLISGGSVSNSQLGIFFIGNATSTNIFKTENVALFNNQIGMDISGVGGNIESQFSGVTINGGVTGIRFYGPQLSLPGNALAGISFSNQSKEYVLQTVKSFEGQTIDASAATFEGLQPTAMTLAQLFATEDKLTHKIDFDSVGYFKLKPNEVFLTPNSFAATLPPVFGIPTFTPQLTRAVGSAINGDTIHIASGNYATANFILDKSVTLIGPNNLVSPNATTDPFIANNARTSEAIISGGTISIGANDIAMKGLSFNPGNRSLIVLTNSTGTNNDFNNFNFEKNILKINTDSANLNQFNITGKLVGSSAMPVTSNYQFDDNRFEKLDTTAGTTFNLNYLKNTTISNNAFVVTGTKQRTQRIANVGGSGLVSDFNLLNNNITGTGFVVNSNRLTNAFVKSNKIVNSDRGLNVVSNMQEGSIIEFSNNMLETNTGGGGFIGYNRSGASVAGAVNSFKVENNIITGVGIPNLPGQFFGSMNFSANNAVLNHSYIIKGNKINFTGDFGAITNDFIRPITVRGNVSNLNLENNELDFSPTVLPLPTPASSTLPINPGITINTEFSTGGNIPANAIINIANNKVNGFKQSLIFYDPFNNPTPYIGYGNIPSGATVNINNNSFTADSISINNGSIGASVNATCNWYGAANAAHVISKVSATTVNFSPWLTDGTDNNVATGFQPLPNICNGIPVVATIVASTNITCNGAANGSIDVSLSGGLAPFTYAWAKDNVAGFSTLQDLTSLAPGDYQLVVTDANGSTDTANAAISQPDVLTLQTSGTNNICFGGNAGSADVLPSGGTAPYSYLWSNAGTSSQIENLPAGTYTVTVTDANGCTASSFYEVTEPTQVTANITNSSTACSNIATVNASGGTPGNPAYSYLWSNGSTSATISGVPVGTYTVTATDANGCTANASIILTVGEAFNPSASVTNVTCFGVNNGIITVNNANGTGQLMFSKDGGVNFVNGSLPFSFTNLAPGNYNIAVKDVNGCTGFVTKTVAQPTQITTSFTVQKTCSGVSTGSINVTVSGGSPAYTYSWSGPNAYASSQLNISNLAAGNYTLTVTDKNNCTAVVSVTVNPFPAIVIARTIIDVACRGGATSSINITPTGGTGSGFTYSWTGGIISSIEDLNNIPKGTYKIRVTDNGSGCIVDSTFIVTEPASNLSLTTARTNATGCNSLGTITGTGSGGTAPYSYNVNGGVYNNFTGIFTGLYGGDYIIGIKDANGCTTTKAVNITDNGGDAFEGNNSKNQAKPIVIGNSVNARIALATDIADWFRFTTPAGSSSYTLSLTHPSANFTYNVFTGANNSPALVPSSTTSTSKTYSLSGNTTYYISVTGGLSFVCYNLMVAVGPPPPQPPLFTKNGSELLKEIPKEISIPESLTAMAFPNPHKGFFNLKISSPKNENAVIELFSLLGQKIAERKVPLIKGENIVAFNGVSTGTIFYKINIDKKTLSGKIIGL